MIERHGNMFGYVGRMKFRLFITTNGFIKNDGTAVMGRGNAAQAVRVFREEYGLNLPEMLGKSLKLRKNVVSALTNQLYTFPVKEHWADRASLKLIKKSVDALKEIIAAQHEEKDLVYVLPRPGCGNGGLKWKHVKPLLEDLPDNVWVICDWNDPQWEEEHGHSVRDEKQRSRSVVRQKTKSSHHASRSRKSHDDGRKHSHSKRRKQQKRNNR